MFEVGHCRRRTTEDGGVEQTTPGREQTQCHKTATQLEALVVDVLVRDLVSGDVQSRPEHEGERPRSDESADRASGRDVQRDDHRPNDRLCSLAMSFLERVRNWLAGPPRVDTGDPEDAAGLKEEFGSSDEGKADVDRITHSYAGGGPVPGLAGRDAAEVAESEIESEEAPPDPDS
jgi:hypothetical protein